ncbi:hypothetical protein HNQ07_001455 [Deinococcus metalli]|uniref:Uncharacterized protein n=1 Tax=Deinococcus metalli TaxID=1141878 RepID=A0A7W8KF74_9DEIO|nr:hypothetical protein [Deinococcus metalli]MBB5375998.1 hypothetical protein [Deinococcus metalli]GHF41581.1 hypothetical protein GCM10017781_17860 [Deinococcus metalli]
MAGGKFNQFELKGAAGSIAKGAWYAFLMILFSRLLIFVTYKIETIFPIPGPDDYYEVLKKGLSFLATWSSLIWFTLFALEDFLLSLIVVLSRGREVVDAIRNAQSK